ncbi:helix-turn-helix transcriptional regulator [Vibrio sp. WXL103]|uniref:helix-turn-helix transcriptional regulator n=1 Tax=unclassified Vibrio TaxID=2614977 RepID=UPI003EC6EEAC
MRSELKFYQYDSRQPSNCGEVLEIDFSAHQLNWDGVVLEKGQSPHFYPNNVYTPYFYFALALEHELKWQIETQDGATDLKTNPGNIWINPPETPFTHHISEPCYFVILAIEKQILLSHCPLNIESMELQFLTNYNVVDETIKAIIELFLLEAKNLGRNGKVYLDHLLSLIANHYVINYSNYHDLLDSQNSHSKFDDNQLNKVDHYIEHNIDQHIAIDDLAELLGCSKFYFLREFKKLLGVTPYQYLLTKRLTKAKAMLATPKANIAMTAMQLGFNDQSHFTRAFKAQFGLTPGQYIKQTSKF